MKNTIIIDAKNSCACDLVSVVDDGSNTLFLEIHADVTANPVLEINGVSVDITEDVFLYEVDSSYWVGTGTLQFRILDYSHTGDYFNITKIGSLSGNITLTQVDNFNYELIVSKPNKILADVADLKEQIDELNSNKIDKPTNDFRGFCSTKTYNGTYGFFVDYPNAYELLKNKQITIVSAYYWKNWDQYNDISNVSVKINEYYPNNIFICTSTEDAAGWTYGCKFSVG